MAVAVAVAVVVATAKARAVAAEYGNARPANVNGGRLLRAMRDGNPIVVVWDESRKAYVVPTAYCPSATA